MLKWVLGSDPLDQIPGSAVVRLRERFVTLVDLRLTPKVEMTNLRTRADCWRGLLRSQTDTGPSASRKRGPECCAEKLARCLDRISKTPRDVGKFSSLNSSSEPKLILTQKEGRWGEKRCRGVVGLN